MVSETAGSGPSRPKSRKRPVLVDEQPVPFARTTDKVAIVGFAEGHRHLAPFDDPTFEIWGLNRLYTVQPGRWTRWFEIHALKGFYEADPAHREWLRTFKGPIYMRPQDVGVYDIPTAVPYPVEQMLGMFPRYFTNSISYMMALAIAMGFKEMHLYGVDMAQDQVWPTNEYRQQRPSCEFFLGYAAAQGIKIYLPPGSDLLKASYMYGLEDGDAIMGKRMSRMQELGKRKDKVREQIEQLETQKMVNDKMFVDQKIHLVSAINQLDGALQQVLYEHQNLSPPPEKEPSVSSN